MSFSCPPVSFLSMGSRSRNLIRSTFSVFEGRINRPKFLSSRRNLEFVYPTAPTLFTLNSPVVCWLIYSPFLRSRSAVLGSVLLHNCRAPFSSGALSEEVSIEIPDDPSKGTVEHLLSNVDDVESLMKMERRSEIHARELASKGRQWFPYLDRFQCDNAYLTSREVIDALDPLILESRKDRMRGVVRNRTYSVCLVVEGLSDMGNVSAAFRSADALGIQSVHVVSCDSTKRYRDNRHVSMGAEKWLDIELWKSTHECFQVLKSRGYRIATAYLGTDAVSIYDLDWSSPTAIVVGNEHRGLSGEALELSDLHCNIPMKGMVDSFNVSVAAGIVMHHAVYERMHSLGRHGDLMPDEQQILLAEFSLRHSKTAMRVAHEYAKRLAHPASIH